MRLTNRKEVLTVRVAVFVLAALFRQCSDLAVVLVVLGLVIQ